MKRSKVIVILLQLIYFLVDKNVANSSEVTAKTDPLEVTTTLNVLLHCLELFKWSHPSIQGPSDVPLRRENKEVIQKSKTRKREGRQQLER